MPWGFRRQALGVMDDRGMYILRVKELLASLGAGNKGERSCCWVDWFG